MMALHVGLRRQEQVAAIVGYSGMLTGAASLRQELASKPPVLLVHGSQDPVVPVTALHMAERELKQLGIHVTSHVCANLGHSVDPMGMRLGCDFVAKALLG